MKKNILFSFIVVFSISFLRAQILPNVSNKVKLIGNMLAFGHLIEDDLMIGDYREEGIGVVLLSNHTGVYNSRNEKVNELNWFFGHDKGNMAIIFTIYKNELNENNQLQIETENKYLLNFKSDLEIDLTNIETSQVINLKRTEPIPNRVYLQLSNIKEKYKNKLFSVFAKKYVDEQLASWQKKGEFEKTSDWEKRVTEKLRKEKIEEYYDEAIDEYAKSLGIKLGFCYIGASLELGSYNADKEVYIIKSRDFGDLPVPVPIDEAEEFKYKSWCSSDSDPTEVVYYIINDEIGLAHATFWDKYEYENPLAKNRKKTKKEIAKESCTLAVNHFKNKEYQQAIDNFEKIISLNSDLMGRDKWRDLGEAYFRTENYAKVIDSYNGFLNRNEWIVDGYDAEFNLYILAAAYLKLKNYPMAIKMYENVLYNESFNAFTEAKICSDLGESYIGTGDNETGNYNYQKAINLLNSLLGTNYTDVAYFYLGNVYKKMGDDKKANNAYKKAAKLGNKEAQTILKNN